MIKEGKTYWSTALKQYVIIKYCLDDYPMAIVLLLDKSIRAVYKDHLVID
jgi:hypothetical protein